MDEPISPNSATTMFIPDLRIGFPGDDIRLVSILYTEHLF